MLVDQLSGLLVYRFTVVLCALPQPRVHWCLCMKGFKCLPPALLRDTPENSQREGYSSVKLKGVLIAIENLLMIVLWESVCRNSALIVGVLASEITSKWLAFMIAPTFLCHPSYPLLPRYWKPVMFEEVKEKGVEQLQKALALQPSMSKEKSCSVITKLKALHFCMSCVPQVWIEAGTEPEVFSLLWMKTSSCLSQQVSDGFSLDILKCL